ncbi:MAG: nitroreductase family protein [bacterium]|nr:nitroreductase family protein [bacterium]
MKTAKPLLSLGGISLAEALLARRSHRKFAPEAIPPDAIRDAIEAACLAPSPHGTSPWRFCVLESAESKQRLAGEMGRDFLRDMEKEGVPEAERARRHAGSLRLLTDAPALILAALSFAGMDRYADPEKQKNEHMMAEHSLGAALQNLMLALAAQGVGSVWRCAPLFCPETARAALDLPADWSPRALIVAGFPTAPALPKAAPSPQVVTR